MTRKLAILTAALLLAPAASRAEGIVFGARLGYAVGMGEAFGDDLGTADQSDWIESQVPLQLEVLFKATPELAVGPYFSYGAGDVGDWDLCGAPGIDCDGSVTRLGVEAIYTFRTPGRFKPWMGAGFGYEWSRVKVSEAFGDSYRTRLRGWELINLQAGGDFVVAPRFRVGPFVQLSVSQYSRYSVKGVFPDTGEYVDYSDDVPEKRIHQWIQLGVRGSFEL